ncbi:MAG TPA: D-alanyl-D-alanine carboxypeptidase/D-alanyl-D-alanine-endopeptidase [Gaiellaceae bacterium]|nr:D-alanyl-D-alanine carboxypeptidase/D-alanyl-D-alanine-endopeptidase [Gaiellaceae bacterium]
MRRALLLVALALVLSQQALAGDVPLSTRLASALAVPGNSWGTSAALAVDLQSNGVVFARNADLSLAPASNEKLPVTFAALKQLGLSYRFKTDVLGRGTQDGAVWHGDLFLKGFGDPTLTSARLGRLAQAIATAGITRIDGRLYGDETWFDTKRAAPGWKLGYFIYECPPLSALVVDRAFYDGHTALEPALAAVGTFRRLLRGYGVTTGPVGLGRAPDTATVLATSESSTLRNVIAVMDRDSDNFRAEMLLKELGAEAGAGGTTAAGAAVVRRVLAGAGVPLAGVVIADGSGLSLLDRLTATAIARILTTSWSEPALKTAFWSALPAAGEQGTLVHRLNRTAAVGAVRAKTGTTNEASALSGYVRDRFAFVVVQNGSPVSATAARRAQDRFAIALARVSASE